MGPFGARHTFPNKRTPQKCLIKFQGEKTTWKQEKVCSAMCDVGIGMLRYPHWSMGPYGARHTSETQKLPSRAHEREGSCMKITE